MTLGTGLSRIAGRARAMEQRTRIGALVGGVLVVSMVVLAVVQETQPVERPPDLVLAQTASPTPTKTPEPTPTATPSPTETPTPTPVAAATSIATPARTATAAPAATVAASAVGAGGLVNTPSQGFPPPPPKAMQSAPNVGGITRIVSPALGIDNYIHTLGVTGGQMDSPDHDGSYAVGWYAPTAGFDFGIPGQGGNSIFSAHETWSKMQGPFYSVHKARAGDQIHLDMANGTRRTYQVISLKRYSIDNIPMAEILWPSNRPANEEWLTLYSCGGRIVYTGSYGDYLDRDVLVAKWVK